MTTNYLTSLLVASSLAFSLLTFNSCSKDSADPEPVTPTTADTMSTTPITEKQPTRADAINALKTNSSDLVVTGIAFDITATTATVAFRINVDNDKLSGARIAVVFSDYPEEQLNYGVGCQEYYIKADKFDGFGIATVTLTELIPTTTYRYRAYYHYSDESTGYGEEQTFTTLGPTAFSTEAVDLGLSVKWANTNLGASRLYQSGLYYHYGDTMRTASQTTLPTQDIHATMYDPATVELGDEWSSPTRAQILELVNSCTWQPATEHGHAGYCVYGTGNHSESYIFIPAVGYYNAAGDLTQYGTGFMLWSGQLGDSNDGKALCLQLISTEANTGSLGRVNKLYRMPIRPVKK